MKKIYSEIIRLIEKYYWLLFAGMTLITAFLCFRCLDVAYVSSWDEARHGISAYEMLKSGDYIVNTVKYEPDYWNLKPPLSFYGIILGFKIFGYSVRGLRFYSACAYLLTCVAVGLFLKRYHKLTSLIGMCFLCCNYLVFCFHGARSGDADAMYLMFFVFAMLAMLEIPRKHSGLYICGFCFACAFLSKSFHACIIAVIGGCFLLFTGEIRRISVREWAGFLLSFMVPLGIWCIFRFSRDGITFFEKMIQTDLLSRSSSASEGHAGSFLFYYDAYFKDFAYIYRCLLLIVAAGAVFYGLMAVRKKALSKENMQEITGYALWLVLPFVFFSAVSTKLIWYGYPILIPLSMIAAIFCGRFLTEELSGDRTIAILVKTVAAGGLLCLVIVHMRSTYLDAVREIHGDELQSFISESVSRDSSYAGTEAYIDAPQEMEDGTVWNQHVLFMAEISGDFRCEDGGTAEFLKADDAVLYITKERYAQKEAILAECEILFEKGSYILLLR
ncbi:MAG: ArnT family glycosyltransferase [Lachnospiraceae bacterium]